jgi:hypothetical protein
MKARYYILIAMICFGTMLYYFISDATLHWVWHVVLFIIGECSFALGMGRMMKNAREYHEEFIWLEEENEEI